MCFQQWFICRHFSEDIWIVFPTLLLIITLWTICRRMWNNWFWMLCSLHPPVTIKQNRFSNRLHSQLLLPPYNLNIDLPWGFTESMWIQASLPSEHKFISLSMAQPSMLIKSCGAVREGGLIFLTRNSCFRFQWLVSVWDWDCPVFHPLTVSVFLSLSLFSSSIILSLDRGLFSLPAQVTVESNKTAVSGKKASLSCFYGLPEKVQQISWKHTSAQGVSTDVASYAKRSDPMIEPPYQGRVWLSPSLSNSQLTIQPVAIEDEGCYTCLYTTHPEGQKSSTVCLATYGKHLFPPDQLTLLIVLFCILVRPTQKPSEGGELELHPGRYPVLYTAGFGSSALTSFQFA